MAQRGRIERLRQRGHMFGRRRCRLRSLAHHHPAHIVENGAAILLRPIERTYTMPVLRFEFSFTPITSDTALSVSPG